MIAILQEIPLIFVPELNSINMKYLTLHATRAIRFRRFDRKGYAIFRSMHKIVNIGMVATATLLFALNDSAQAQVKAQPKHPVENGSVELEEVEVTASRSAMPINRAAKIVTVLTARDIAAAPVTSIQDLLEYATGVDVRQRGEGGTQSDISIRGGTFDQIAVLLNGVNLSNPQTGHYSFDLPVNLSDIERIEIISGPSSRIFGASAFAGAINIITKTGQENRVTAEAYAAKHQTWKLESGINHTTSHFDQRLSAGYQSSGGYTDNTDYKILNLFWQSELRTEEAKFNFQAGYNDKGYGANSFYTAAYPNQYDHTRRLFASVGAETHGKIRFTPKVYWTRHFDRFELFRSEPASWYKGHNYHETQVFGANLNATADWSLGRTSAGVEFRNEGVRSNVLGHPLDEPIEVPFEKGNYYTKSDNRTNISYFLEHQIEVSRLIVSLGVLANYNTALNNDLSYYPGIDVSYRLTPQLRLYGSWNKALRMPTFTDLYYESKTNKGNPHLRPEKSEAFEMGVKYDAPALKAHLAGFYHKGKDMIDWVKLNPDDLWESQNLTQLDNVGLESNITFLPRQCFSPHFFIQKVELGYAYIHQKKDSKGYLSNYALNYLKHKFTGQITHSLFKGMSATWYTRWQDRAGAYIKYENLKPTHSEDYAPYCLVDLKLNWQHKNWVVYTEMNNLFNSTYYDLGNIPQPGFGLKVGCRYTFSY